MKTKAIARSTDHTAQTSASPSVSPAQEAPQAPMRVSWMKGDLFVFMEEEIGPAPSRLDTLTKDELTARTKICLRHEISFISNKRFTEPDAGARIFSQPFSLTPGTKSTSRAKLAHSEFPIHLGRLCEAALLTPENESLLFERMNFLLHQAAVHRSCLNPKRPSRARLALIERLISYANWHRDRIVEANLRLVFSIVKKFVNANNPFDELLSDGIMALIRAVEKFDFDRGFRFSTYATQVVRRNAYRTVVLNQQERLKVMGGLSDMDLQLSDENHASSISEHRWHELRSRLTTMLDDLDRREKLIIRARFSLGSHRRVHTLQSLADRLGISKERVRQLERRAMEKLRLMASEVQLVDLEP